MDQKRTENNRPKLLPTPLDQLQLHLPTSRLTRGDGAERTDFHEGTVEGGAAGTALLLAGTRSAWVRLGDSRVEAWVTQGKDLRDKLTLNQKITLFLPALLLAWIIIKLLPSRNTVSSDSRYQLRVCTFRWKKGLQDLRIHPSLFLSTTLIRAGIGGDITRVDGEGVSVMSITRLSYAGMEDRLERACGRLTLDERRGLGVRGESEHSNLLQLWLFPHIVVISFSPPPCFTD